MRAHIRSYFKAPKGSGGDAARQAALRLYLGMVEVSFPMQLAHELELPVWAAPLGYGSEPGTVVPTNYSKTGQVTRSLKVMYKGTFPPDLKKDQWWRVSWFFRN